MIAQRQPVPTPSLTPRAQTLLAFVERYMAQFGYAPTYLEMANALGLKSKTGACPVLDELKSAGRIRRLSRRQQAIEVVKPERAVSRYAQLLPLVRALDAPIPSWVRRATKTNLKIPSTPSARATA